MIKLLMLICLLFVSCGPGPERERKIETKSTINGYEISIIVFDDCEYLVTGGGYSQTLTHKGNCKFCVDRLKH